MISTLPPFESTPQPLSIGVWDYSPENGSVTANRNLSDIYGYEQGAPDWSMELFMEHIVPEDKERVAQSIAQLLATGEDFFAEYRISRLDGQIRAIRSIGCTLFEHGKPSFMLRGVTYDITDLKEGQNDLLTQKQQWAFAINELGLGFWLREVGAAEVHRNGIHAEIFGYIDKVQPEWTLSHFLDHVHPEEREQVKSIITSSEQLGKNYRFECRIKRNDGQIRWISVSGKVIQREGKGITFGVTQDITEAKMQELELQDMEAKLIQSQKMELLGQLAGGITHDINNALTIIHGNTELATAEVGDNSSLADHLQSILEAVARSSEMIKQLLAFARKDIVKPVSIILDDELRRMTGMLERLIRENISLELDAHCPEASISLDPAKLTQILTNLIINARDAIAGQGAIKISTNALSLKQVQGRHPLVSGHDHYLQLLITDTGSGIPQHILPHIFEPFFTTKGVGEGTGLGLSTVYGLVKQNHGHIFCTSSMGEGTRFELYFPACQNTSAPLQDQGEAESAQTAARNGHILIIDDEREIVRMLQSILQNAGFHVCTSGSAEEALELIGGGDIVFDLIISDIMLSGITGLEMRARVMDSCPTTKFLFMSGYSFQIIERYGSLSETEQFLPKPFSISTLIKKVNSILQLTD